MKMIVGGGYGEYGRSCFYIKGKNVSFILDCGIMAGAENPFPYLSKDEISDAKYLFLTHSHTDHANALPWLYKNGFEGTVFLSEPTFNQMEFKPEKICFLDESKTKTLENISFSWGRSGHCPGSLWYFIECEGKKILFSGDYVEDTLIYQCDYIRDKSADLAILDCAYKNEINSAKENYRSIATFLDKEKKSVVFPLPKYGRGLELVALLALQDYKKPIYVDNILFQQLQDEELKTKWFKLESMTVFKENTVLPLKLNDSNLDGFFIICDAQLKNDRNRLFCEEILKFGGKILLTSNKTVKSYSKSLYDDGKAEFLRYSVHQNEREMKQLVTHNNFKKVIPYHCKLDVEIKLPVSLDF